MQSGIVRSAGRFWASVEGEWLAESMEVEGEMGAEMSQGEGQMGEEADEDVERIREPSPGEIFCIVDMHMYRRHCTDYRTNGEYSSL